MKNNILLACLLSTMTLPSLAADAVNIKVTGKVIASPCVVNNGSSDLAVDLSDIQASSLAVASATSPAVDFSLDFKNCPAGTTSVKAVFSGTPDSTNPKYYQNTGTATGVAVGLYQASNGFGRDNGTYIVQPVLEDGTVSIALQARAFSLAGAPTPGTISATIVATMEYN
ncbi:fimbrial protein [Lelliottia wanjuensis]|uniref:Fimbrial protein n=1 Tax=Lelliottia wanjuensis TaxID=3050585 RepID=A0AAP4FTQ9_9ENTR|nr:MULTISPECIES: fimbrial protein [unclassified Lelliottia]MDK9362345.1 fimbrial protein [Lelliottia sp. V106_12]MDK9616844.1 fimbrial protein [Lelliottia sp. V106_9]